MPRIVKLYIKNALLGFVAAAVFVGLLLGFDVMGLWGLILRSDVTLLAVFILWFMNGIVFAGVQFGWAVMALAQKPEQPGGGKSVPLQAAPVTLPVVVTPRRLN
ncbi:MAG: hypothetical protein ACU0BB_00175 [Paracoccaceae bacterium]